MMNYLRGILSSSRLLEEVIRRWGEPGLFILFSLISLNHIWAQYAFITLDGPSHLYNSKLLLDINIGEALSKYYSVQYPYLPNYCSHVFTGILLNFFDPLIAEKILISSILILLTFSTRHLVLVMRGDFGYFTFLIFLLPFNKLLQNGFYNFIAAFAFMNFAMVIFFKYKNTQGKISGVIYATLNGVLLYYSNLLVFALTFLIITIWSFVHYNSSEKLKLKNFIYLLTFLPGLVMGIFFLSSTSISNYNYDMSQFDKVISLICFDIGATFDTQNEIPYTSLITILLCFSMGFIAGGRRVFLRKLKQLFSINIFLVVSLCSIFLVFISKDGDFGGMFSRRLFFIIFYFAILWIIIKLEWKMLFFAGSLIICFVVFLNLMLVRSKMFKEAEPVVRSVIETGKYIPDHSLVHSINLSHMWYEQHYSSYLGIYNSPVLMDNYEAVLRWFPIVWKKDLLYYLLSVQNNIIDENTPDYVYVFGDIKRFKEEGYLPTQQFIESNCELVYQSENALNHLYKVNKFKQDLN
ncbi:MAG TPA: hypothetical protein PLQ93_09200 [Bacteroidia bacterium]|nr:hypothetical protein [Bacteroidia bacterium]